MDLRPINPYYRMVQPVAWSLRNRMTATYSYPYAWIEPVTDRTKEDVIYTQQMKSLSWEDMTVEQQEEYLLGLKGCMNYTDFLRIENNIQILLDVLEIDSASYVENVPEFPQKSYFVDMRNNVLAIREGYCVYDDTPQVPELPYNTWEKYNAIEQILVDVYEVVSAQFHYYAGEEIYAGEEAGLLL